MTSEEKRRGVIWITEAMLKYGHSREWFKRRIAAGEIHEVPQPGTSRVYLDLGDVERAVKQEGK